VSARSLSLRVLRGICRRRSVILGYHGVGHTSRRDDLSLLVLSPNRFRGQVELLLEAGFRFVTLAELAHLADAGKPPPGYAAVTFDDGMRNNHEVALPLLREYSINATVYVTIGFIGGGSPWVSSEAGAMMDEGQLRELAAAGWELGAHTMTHPDLSALDYDSCLREIGESRVALEGIIGGPVETFAYPFGRYGAAAVAAARDSGLIAAVTSGSGSWDPYELTRAMVGAADPSVILFLKLTDRYEPLLRSPPMRALRQGSKQLRARVQNRRQSPA